MNRSIIIAAGITVIVIQSLYNVDYARAEPVDISSTRLWPDADGTHVNAHCGGLIKVGDTYYWFGEFRAFGPVQNISCYSSTDLAKWTLRNKVITPKTHEEVAKSNLERPKVIYNAKTKKFVMWIHKEASRGYAQARAAVASCDTVDGDYTWHGDFRPFDNMSRDCTLFQDDDGTAYFISSSRENADMIIYKLSDDYLKAEKQVATIFPGQYREAPALFKRNGKYYLITSFCTGIRPNPQYYTTADSVAGPWSPLKYLTYDDTWNTYYSQSNFVLPVKGTETTTYIYCGDNWMASPMRHVWLPLKFNDDGSLAPMRWFDRWQIDAATGQCKTPDAPTASPGNLAKDRPVSSDYDIPSRMADYDHFAAGEPSAANDGDKKTAWRTRDNLPGHWWKVDLGSAADISGVKIQWHRNGVFAYKIETSEDDANWTVQVDESKNTKRHEEQSHEFEAKGVRYVRLTFTSTPSAYDWPGLAEFSVVAGEKELAKGKIATADNFCPNTDCTKAVDGDCATAWTIDDRSKDRWLKVDLEKPTDVGGCRILWEAPGYYYQYKIETSADDKDWTTAVDMTENKEVDRLPTHKFDAKQIRYVRITITGYERRCWPGIREFEILPQ